MWLWIMIVEKVLRIIILFVSSTIIVFAKEAILSGVGVIQLFGFLVEVSVFVGGKVRRFIVGLLLEVDFILTVRCVWILFPVEVEIARGVRSLKVWCSATSILTGVVGMSTACCLCTTSTAALKITATASGTTSTGVSPAACVTSATLEASAALDSPAALLLLIRILLVLKLIAGLLAVITSSISWIRSVSVVTAEWWRSTRATLSLPLVVLKQALLFHERHKIIDGISLVCQVIACCVEVELPGRWHKTIIGVLSFGVVDSISKQLCTIAPW